MFKAIVVLSGGQDSTTALYLAKEQGYDEIHTITFNYGQRHRRELESARTIAALAGVTSHEQIDIDPEILRSVSPLVDCTKQLEQYASHDEMEKIIGDRVELTFVPMRNALFFTIAANRAVHHGAEFIWTGVCQEDNANYPDCTTDFLSAQGDAIRTALGRSDILIVAPLVETPKPEALLRYAATMPSLYAALGYSHTAYDGSYPPSGHDHATVLRAHAFAQAGMPDPLLVRAYLEGAISDLPDTENYTRFLENFAQMKNMRDADMSVHALLRSMTQWFS